MGTDRTPASAFGFEKQQVVRSPAGAVAHGARVVTPIEDKPHQGGGRGYTCRDPEGNLWNVGSYDPFRPEPRPAESPR